ncbi:hypothetical protein AAW51_0863 [Caldimonas brevitalea]|uniref:Uncharacterized protein n=1 Tax=Caldimonas brevitalea TaxID=413882 RepID=A0A0G3BDQ8_9BURK|nr:hypothetical protein AAW51_0863 [Caldimonas brevitalea]
MKVTIKWREDGEFKRDAQGQIVKEDGVPVIDDTPWKTRTVEVPEYSEKDLEHFDIHFLPGDKVFVKASFSYPEHPDYQPAYPQRKPTAAP